MKPLKHQAFFCPQSPWTPSRSFLLKPSTVLGEGKPTALTILGISPFVLIACSGSVQPGVNRPRGSDSRQKGWGPLLERKGELWGEALPRGRLDLGGSARLPLKGHGPRLLRGPRLSQELQQEAAGRLPLWDTCTTASAALLQCPPVR